MVFMEKQNNEKFKEHDSISLEVWKATLLVIEKLDREHRNQPTSFKTQESQIKEMVVKTYKDFGRSVDIKDVDSAIKEVMGKQNQRKYHTLTLDGVFYKKLPSEHREKELFLLLKRKGFFDEELQALFLNESVRSSKVSKNAIKLACFLFLISLIGFFSINLYFSILMIPAILFSIRSYGFHKRKLRYQKFYQSVLTNKWNQVFNFTKKIVGLKQLSYHPKLNEQVIVFERELNPWAPIDENESNIKKAIEMINSNPETKCILDKWKQEGCPIREYEFLSLFNYAKPNIFDLFKSWMPSMIPLLNLFRKK